MGRFTTARDRKQGAVAIIGCVFLFTAFGVLVYGRFATSVGAAALYNRASVGVGFILFGISMLCFTPMVYLQRMHRRRIDPAVLARELKGILLGFFCYVVPFFLAMGALSSADSTGAFGLVLMVAFGAIPFVYRRHRKKDPISYKHTGSAAIVAFCGVFAVISIAGGAFSCSEMLDDLNGGWRQERFAFYEAETQQAARPRGGAVAYHVRGLALQGRGVGGEPPGGRAPQRERGRLARGRACPRRADGRGSLVPQDPHPRGRARRGRSCHRGRPDRVGGGNGARD